jgi:hypothetical protein
MDFNSYTNNLPYSNSKGDREANLAYRAEDRRLTEKFKNDLFEDLGVENHPKREKLYELARDTASGEGLERLYEVACDFVELMNL